jgi:CheY-like chemotaxis protein
MRMPDMDDAALTREIADDPTLSTTRIIHLTAIGCRSDSAGAAARVAKPVKPQALYECLKRVMEYFARRRSGSPGNTAGSPTSHAPRARAHR